MSFGDDLSEAVGLGGIILTVVKCDVCETSPVVGTFHHCLVCPGFDMCDQCKEKGQS